MRTVVQLPRVLEVGVVGWISRRVVFVLVLLVLGAGELLMVCLPSIRRAVEESIRKKHPDYITSNMTWTGVAVIANFITLDLFKHARQGKQAPDVTLHTLEGAAVRLLSRARPGRPLVVNMGSCSSPTFIKGLQELRPIRVRFSPLADFVTVYCWEAHPADLLPSPQSRFTIKIPSSLADRLASASVLLPGRVRQDEVVVDTMDKAMCHQYGAGPLRLAVILDGVVVYLGGFGPIDYRPKEVEEYLERFQLSQGVVH